MVFKNPAAARKGYLVDTLLLDEDTASAKNCACCGYVHLCMMLGLIVIVV
jgi:hypothetical protein